MFGASIQFLEPFARRLKALDNLNLDCAPVAPGVLHELLNAQSSPIQHSDYSSNTYTGWRLFVSRNFYQGAGE